MSGGGGGGRGKERSVSVWICAHFNWPAEVTRADVSMGIEDLTAEVPDGTVGVCVLVSDGA